MKSLPDHQTSSNQQDSFFTTEDTRPITAPERKHKRSHLNHKKALILVKEPRLDNKTNLEEGQRHSTQVKEETDNSPISIPNEVPKRCETTEMLHSARSSLFREV